MFIIFYYYYIDKQLISDIEISSSSIMFGNEKYDCFGLEIKKNWEFKRHTDQLLYTKPGLI